MTNQFDSNGGGQNTAQGDHAIGKQENVTQEVRGDGCISSGMGNVTVNQGVPLKPKTVVIVMVLCAALLGAGLACWLYSKAREGMTLNTLAIAKGDYAAALKLLEQSLRITQKSGDKKQEGAMLNNIGQIYYARGDDVRGDYGIALKYLEQSLRIRQEIGDKKTEGATLNNISQIYSARGDCGTALKYLEQSLVIRREIGDRRGEAATSWNIGLTYEKQGDHAKAEAYISRAVQLAEELGLPTLNESRKALEAVRAKLRGNASQGKRFFAPTLAR